METMTGAELKVLHSYINKATHYLEFGSGSSTIYAAGRKNLKFIDSVESSKDYINESQKPHYCLNCIFGDIVVNVLQNDEHVHHNKGHMRNQVLTGSNDLEVNEGDQHSHQGAHCVENTICNIYLEVQLIDKHHTKHIYSI